MISSVFRSGMLPWSAVPAFLLLGQASLADVEQVLIRVSTGSVSGVYYQIGIDLCRELNKRRTDNGIWCAVEASDGSAENLARLISHRSELAIAQSDVVAAFNFEHEGDVSIIGRLYTEKLHAFTWPGAAISGYQDIRGKRVSLGDFGSGTRPVVESILEALQIEMSSFSVVRELSPISQVEELCSGRIDVSFWMAAAPNPIGDELTTVCSIGLLGLSEAEAIELLRQDNIVTGRITSEEYVAVEDPITTAKVDALLVTGPDLSPELVTRITAAIADSEEVLRRNSRFLENAEFE